MIYDLNHHESFEAINNWLGFVNQYTNKEQVKLVLVGNKKDLERKVTFEEGEKLAKKEGMLFYEASAKTGEGVIDMFFGSFALIDFFNDKRNDNNNDEIIKELIEQNMNSNQRLNKNPSNVKNVTGGNNNNDIISKNELIDKNNNSINADNIIKINPQDQTNKQKEKKKCGC